MASLSNELNSYSAPSPISKKTESLDRDIPRKEFNMKYSLCGYGVDLRFSEKNEELLQKVKNLVDRFQTVCHVTCRNVESIYIMQNSSLDYFCYNASPSFSLPIWKLTSNSTEKEYQKTYETFYKEGKISGLDEQIKRQIDEIAKAVKELFSQKLNYNLNDTPFSKTDIYITLDRDWPNEPKWASLHLEVQIASLEEAKLLRELKIKD